jgi:hypothetical protein
MAITFSYCDDPFLRGGTHAQAALVESLKTSVLVPANRDASNLRIPDAAASGRVVSMRAMFARDTILVLRAYWEEVGDREFRIVHVKQGRTFYLVFCRNVGGHGAMPGASWYAECIAPGPAIPLPAYRETIPATSGGPGSMPMSPRMASQSLGPDALAAIVRPNGEYEITPVPNDYEASPYSDGSYDSPPAPGHSPYGTAFTPYGVERDMD